MVRFVKAKEDDIELVMKSRLEMLKAVNSLPSDYRFSEALIRNSKEYLESKNQTTVLAVDEDAVIGCATLCYLEMLPTFSHPTGQRAHLMNVYTNAAYRRQGIALKMLNMLIEEARERGVTEISLDATEEGRPLYKRCGFTESEECMVFNLR